MRPKAVAAVALGATVLVGGALALRARSSGRRAGRADRDAFSLRPEGERFRLSLTQELHSKGGAPKRVRISGVWESAGSAVASSASAPNARSRRAFRLVEVQVVSEAGAAPGSGSEFAGAVGRPFLVSYVGDCPEQASFAPGVPTAARNVLLTVVGELPPGRPPASTLVTPARDVYGRYLAALRPDADGRGFERRKMQYLDLTVPEAGQALKTATAIAIGESVWRARYQAGGGLASLEGHERVTIDTGVPGLAPEVSTDLRLDAAGTFDARPLIDALAGDGEGRVSTAIVTQQVDPTVGARTADAELVAGASLAELLAAVDRPTPDGGAPSLAARHAAIDRLAALVRLEPAAVAEIVSRIRGAHGIAMDSRRADLIAALGLANHPSARLALATLLADPILTRELRLAAVQALAQGDVDVASIAALEGGLDDGDKEMAQAAAYATGTALAGLRLRDPSGAAPVVARLVARVAPGQDAATRIVALRSLGNAADPSTMSVVRSALGDPQPTVRVAAVQALRMMMVPGVDDAITEVLRHDRDATVRSAAILSAGFRDLTTYADALADAALKDEDGIVRSAAVIALGRIFDRSPRSRQALTVAAKKDPNIEIRKQARRLLDEGPVSPSP